MSAPASAGLQLAALLLLLLALAKPLGAYVADVFSGERTFLSPVLAPIERSFLRLAGIPGGQKQGFAAYANAFLAFNLLGVVVVYALLRLQGHLPLNPRGFGAVPPDVAFNTAVSFVSNTNWQSYGGETTLSHGSQLWALTTQNFVSAASGLAVLVALARGLRQHADEALGSFWVDLVKGTVHVLLPLSLVYAVFLVSQGVVQTFAGNTSAALLAATHDGEGRGVTAQIIALGPAASQVAIKQLGTNGGGFFNANGAHPFENPTALGNFVQTASILLLPAALCFAFGKLVDEPRQARVLLAAMLALFVPLALACTWAELSPNPLLAQLPGIDQSVGNLEGKEARFGVVGTTLWATATTAASNGSVNGMHDSFSPLGGMVPLFAMQLGEIVFGGVGSGLYGMLTFVVIAVFVAGLMVGRTPEYLGKKIEAHEMKMAALIILFPAGAALLGTALACATAAGRAGIGNPGAHGFTEVLYAYSSAANNNGSAFGGLTANTPFYDTTLGLAMLVGRYGVAVPVLALAGSLARKKIVPASTGTLPTHGPLFVGLVLGTIVLVGALTFLPALALGPVAEHLQPTSAELPSP